MSLAIFVEYVIVPYAHNVRCIRSKFTQHGPFLSTATQSCVLAGGKHWAIPGLWRPYAPGVFFLHNSAKSMVEYTTYISSRHLRCLGYNPGIRHMWNASFRPQRLWTPSFAFVKSFLDCSNAFLCFELWRLVTSLLWSLLLKRLHRSRTVRFFTLGLLA